MVLLAPRAVRLTTGRRMDPDRSLAVSHVQYYDNSDDVAKFVTRPRQGLEITTLS